MLEFIQNNVVPAVWCIIGILLVLSEFVVPGFFIIFFGLAAIALGIVFYIVPDISAVSATFLYLILSVGSLVGSRVLFPKTFRGNVSRGGGNPDADGVEGALAVVKELVKPGVPGKVEFRGSLWNAASDIELKPETNVIVVRRDNLTLYVKKQ